MKREQLRLVLSLLCCHIEGSIGCKELERKTERKVQQDGE